MTKLTLELKHPPVEAPNGGGEPDISISRADYIQLLIRGSVTDPAAWPASMQEAAPLLARIRQIEADCTSQHGAFDCDLLAAGVEDEYESLVAQLERATQPELQEFIQQVRLRRQNQPGK